MYKNISIAEGHENAPTRIAKATGGSSMKVIYRARIVSSLQPKIRRRAARMGSSLMSIVITLDSSPVAPGCHDANAIMKFPVDELSGHKIGALRE